jgi:hypothetical protein
MYNVFVYELVEQYIFNSYVHGVENYKLQQIFTPLMSPIKWIMKVKGEKRYADHPAPTSVRTRNPLSPTSTALYSCRAGCLKTGTILGLFSHFCCFSIILNWVIPVCYFYYIDNEHSLTHRSMYLFCTLHHFTPRLCQYTTCFGSAELTSGTSINVKNTDP